MRRTWWVTGASVALLALLLWTFSGRDTAEAPRPDDAATPDAQARQPGGAAAPSVRVELMLLPDGPVRAIPASVRVGLGYVSPDDAARAAADLETGPRADTGSYSELAIPARWVSAPAQLLADGRVKVGPLELPPADQYTLQAQGEDGLRFYMAGFTSGAMPRSIAPLVGAGVRTHIASPGAAVLLRRVSSSAPPPAWQRLQEWIAPQMLEAFNEQPLPVENGQVLAPLAPGPIEVILEVDGVEAERRLLTLPAGRIVDVRFDPMSQAVARAVSIDLQLEFVRRGDGTPVTGLRVDWLGDRTQQHKTTDARGQVVFAQLDGQQSHQFNLHANVARTGLPEWPELIPLQIEPDELSGAGTAGNLVRHRIELTPLRWLIARLPPEAARSRPSKGSPYPIYVLQRRREDRWVDAAAAHFIPTPEGLAVSVEEPGVYRIATALSPWHALESSVARVDDTEPHRVDFAGMRGRDVTMTVLRDGRALAGAPVSIIGPFGKLPPAMLKADGSGRITLASATVPSVRIEVPGSDQIEVRLAGSRVMADFGSRSPQ